MSRFTRMLQFCRFTLTEYVRSGRILVELLATVAVFSIFLSRQTFQPDYFFSTTALFALLLTFYTTTSMLNLGDRPQGYVLLARNLGRGGYLLGLFLSAVLLNLAAYLLVSLGVVVIGTSPGLGIRDWLLGSAPLLLNAALASATLTLLSPLVVTTRWRLLALLIVALAFSGTVLNGETLARVRDAAPAAAQALDIIRTVFTLPLLPAFNGFALAVSRDYGGTNAVVLLAQFCLLAGMLLLAVYAFRKRDIILSGN